MSCSNCFNGCSEIVSDRCVRYTGVDVPVLGIKTGDSLSYVEQALIEFLTSTLDGSGIKPNIDPTIICNLVKQYLPTCGDLTVTDLLTALIKAACDLQTQVTAIVAQLAVIEAPYNVDCLTGVTSTSGTHAILQAVITKLCTLETSLTALALNVSTNYVAIADINDYIAAYLASLNPGGTVPYSEKMLPYTAVEYYGSLSNFDSTGAGIIGTQWEKIYLCNGLNGTPDKRGRVGVGAIKNVPGGPLDTAVDPLTPVTGIFNPNYDLGTKAGSNSVILTIQQIPLHSHTATTTTATITPATHSHLTVGTNSDVTSPTTSTYITASYSTGGNLGYSLRGSNTSSGGRTTDVTQSIAVAITNGSTGQDQPHSNNQPALACYYIMYIP